VVENQGRTNDGLVDHKGILGNVSLNGRVLTDWTLTGVKLDEPEKLTKMLADRMTQSKARERRTPGFWAAAFDLNCASVIIKDTFLSLSAWGKGSAFVNGFNLGRYWPNLGPQGTLYAPKPIFRCGRNILALLELERAGCEKNDCLASLVAEAELNLPTPFDSHLDDVGAGKSISNLLDLISFL